jgi:hypothetical protein
MPHGSEVNKVWITDIKELKGQRLLLDLALKKRNYSKAEFCRYMHDNYRVDEDPSNMCSIVRGRRDIGLDKLRWFAYALVVDEPLELNEKFEFIEKDGESYILATGGRYPKRLIKPKKVGDRLMLDFSDLEFEDISVENY